ncbi:oxidoreductase [Sinorhizobium meliloti CCBAU 01290]|nr:oxidoreductase [Sinorhizobium meliloti CCBAU 01290]
MDIRQINDEYSVSGQITATTSTRSGARLQVHRCHRPDFEAPDQPTFDAIAARAQELGLEVTHIPVGPMGVTADAVKSMVDALDEFQRPMLGYCRSGARSTAVYQQTLHIRG